MFYVYSQPLAGDEPHGTGFVSRQHLANLLPPSADVDCYFLGPKPFMKNILQLSKDLGVPAEQVHFEFFGPLQELEEEFEAVA